MDLSFKQQKFLSFVQRHTVEYGQAPSYEEIMDGMGFASLGTVHWYVNALTHNGHLDRSKGPNGKRALALTHEEHATPARLPLLGLIAAGDPHRSIGKCRIDFCTAAFYSSG